METITDFIGNEYAAERLREQESPGFDVEGAKRDRAWQTLGEIMASVGATLARKGDTVTILRNAEDIQPAPKKFHEKTGVVFWVGDDKFAGRAYGSDMQQALSKSRGNDRRAGVLLSDGSRIFVPLRSAKPHATVNFKA